ncbi:hypothetical protein GCM10023195_52870 [Actinoallomurus liliacearum]|uniref:Uncharacterized protein n=1 Tax=Actinoallomurus liliacearum TaxID=1080073 RepID=A0ABP8TSA7_9ACTN
MNAAEFSGSRFIPGYSGGPWFYRTGTGTTVFAVTSADAFLPDGTFAAPLRPDTFGEIFATADRWSRTHG